MGIKRISDKRRAQLPLRQKVREELHQRSGSTCEYQHIIPEIPCGTRPGRQPLEIDEIRGGSYRSQEWLNPERCKLTCPAHHDYKTAHTPEIRRRLGDL